MHEIESRVAKGERALVTTLTKKMAEDLTSYLSERSGIPPSRHPRAGSRALRHRGSSIKVRYLHSDVETLERITILRELREGKFDVLVGVNLLREGLDLPEVSLVAILDADKEGFLRSEVSLIQTIGRAARNVNGKVIMYADNVTGSMRRAIDETARRRKIQLEYNKRHGITPKTIQKAIKNMMEEFGIESYKRQETKGKGIRGRGAKGSTASLDLMGDARPLKEIIKDKEMQMREAAQKLEFELAAILRDEVRELKLKEKMKKE